MISFWGQSPTFARFYFQKAVSLKFGELVNAKSADFAFHVNFARQNEFDKIIGFYGHFLLEHFSINVLPW